MASSKVPELDFLDFSVRNMDTGELMEIDFDDGPAPCLSPLSSMYNVEEQRLMDTITTGLEEGERISARIVNRAHVASKTDKPYTVYVINVWRENHPRHPWVVYRRYRDFSVLHDRLRRLNCAPAHFPGKKVLGLFDSNFLDKRQAALGVWLEQVATMYNGAGAARARLAFVEIFFMDGANERPEGLGEKPPDPVAPQKVTLASFELCKVIGKGSFGKVVLAKKKDTGNVYAMKILNKANIIKRRQVEHTKTERRVLGYTKHPYVVGLHYAFQSRTRLYFVLDYCAGGELFFHLGRLGRFREDMACFYTAQLVLGLGHLHALGVVYRDLKPENVLLDGEGHLRIADFGLSKEGISAPAAGTSSFCGTPEYLAPEILDRRGHGTAVDWWSLGMLLYEMLTGLPPWYTRDRKQLYESIRSAPLEIPNYVSPTAQSVLRGMLLRDPTRRLGGVRDAEDFKAHAFFARIDWDAMLRRELKPPFAPTTTSSTDTRYFDEQFTTMAVGEPESVGNGSFAAGASLTGTFGGFTFEAPSEMSVRVRDAHRSAAAAAEYSSSLESPSPGPSTSMVDYGSLPSPEAMWPASGGAGTSVPMHMPVTPTDHHVADHAPFAFDHDGDVNM